MNTIGRNAAGHFVPGQSANPGGRRATPPEVAAIFEQLTPRAARRLGELVDSQDEKIALAAAEALLNRTLGKPATAVEVSGPEGRPVSILRDLSPIEQARRVAYILNRGLQAKRDAERAAAAEAELPGDSNQPPTARSPRSSES